jgi:hypothetical protein
VVRKRGERGGARRGERDALFLIQNKLQMLSATCLTVLVF